MASVLACHQRFPTIILFVACYWHSDGVFDKDATWVRVRFDVQDQLHHTASYTYLLELRRCIPKLFFICLIKRDSCLHFSLLQFQTSLSWGSVSLLACLLVIIDIYLDLVEVSGWMAGIKLSFTVSLWEGICFVRIFLCHFLKCLTAPMNSPQN